MKYTIVDMQILNWEIIGRSFQDAKERGLKTFFDGVPCVHGHIAFRVIKGKKRVVHVCKRCIQLESRSYHSNHKEEDRERVRKWRLDNPEKYTRQHRNYYTTNQEDILKVCADYRENNRPKCRETRRNYKKNNPDKSAADVAYYRARKRQAAPSWLSPEQLQQIDDIYALAYQKSLEEGIDYEVDHIIPVRGKTVCGLHVPWNLQILDFLTNRRKSAKIMLQ